MSDKYRDLLEQYDVKVISTFRSRGTFQCETDQGLALLKEYHSSLRKLAMEYEWKEKLAEAGFSLTDRYFLSREDSLVVYDRYHTPFVLKHYFSGRECDLGNPADVYAACQNLGLMHRISSGIRWAVVTSGAFCLAVSALVFVFAQSLMGLFVDAGETEILAVGVEYLRIEGSFYIGIGWLFLLYGLYRAVAIPLMSVALTVISLGTRVALAYLLSAIPSIGVLGIWWSVPIGWFLADLTGFLYYLLRRRQIEGRLYGSPHL